MASAVEQKVKQIIVEQLGVDESQVDNKASFVDDLGAAGGSGPAWRAGPPEDRRSARPSGRRAEAGLPLRSGRTG